MGEIVETAYGLASYECSHDREWPVPNGPTGKKRSADVIGETVHVRTGEIDDGKDPAAKALGKKGGLARAVSLTPEERTRIARKAARLRWKGHKKSDPEL